MSAILQVVGSAWSALGLGSGFFYETRKKLILGVVGKVATGYAVVVFAAVILDVTLPSVPYLDAVVDGLQNVVVRVGWGGLNFAVFHVVGKELGRTFNNAK